MIHSSFPTLQRTLAASVFLFTAGLCAGQTVTEVRVPGSRVYPESITSTSDGTLIIGTLGLGSVMRARHGQATAEEWIKPGTGGLNNILGVLADEKANTLWVCSNNLDNKGEATALKSFDLKTGAPKATYPLPGNTAALCNDIAVGSDGTAYVADTKQAQILMLKRGAKTFEIAAKDDKLAGADGLAFGQKTTLYVNSVSANKLFRLDLAPDGTAKTVVELTLSRKVDRPDGFRPIGKDRFLMAENNGTLDLVTIQGKNATIKTLKEGMESTPGVTATKGMAWIVEGKLNYRNDAAMKDKDPGVFRMFAVPLPK